MTFYVEQRGNPTLKSMNRAPDQLFTQFTYSATLLDVSDH